eukprot:1181538-Prorocentrum_minimum.AAC.2
MRSEHRAERCAKGSGTPRRSCGHSARPVVSVVRGAYIRARAVHMYEPPFASMGEVSVKCRRP